MTLPLLVSVPHAGLWVPPEVASLCVLRKHEILEDSDGGAAEIYWRLEPEVAAFVTADVARVIVDLNRAENDRRADGVVKTHTCWNVPVYREPLSESMATALLTKFHAPYHDKLRELGRSGVRLGVDCHTMSATGPALGPDPGRKRPPVCLSNADGTCPDAWFQSLAACLEKSFETPIALNDPFQGGHIIRSHAAELPWVQIELSRAPDRSHDDKSARVLQALTEWCSQSTPP